MVSKTTLVPSLYQLRDQTTPNDRDFFILLLNNCFKHKNPKDKNVVPGGFLSDCSQDTFLEKEALADKYLLGNTTPFNQYQFERTAFFSVDPDTTSNQLIFNRTVTLKEEVAKKGESSGV